MHPAPTVKRPQKSPSGQVMAANGIFAAEHQETSQFENPPRQQAHTLPYANHHPSSPTHLNRQDSPTHSEYVFHGRDGIPPSPIVTPPMKTRKASEEQDHKQLPRWPPGNLPVAPHRGRNEADQHPLLQSIGEGETGGASEASVPVRTETIQRGVPHIYHDHAQSPDPPPAVAKKKTGGVVTPFPEKLHEMLDKESDYHRSEDDVVVTWCPHGRAFVVKKPKIFTEKIMPKYFKQTKLTSFQRQLNLYGFRRITRGPDNGAYYHELFLRSRPQLSATMVRQKVKGTGHKQPSDASSEPNFYSMPNMPESSSATSTFRQAPPTAATASVFRHDWKQEYSSSGSSTPPKSTPILWSESWQSDPHQALSPNTQNVRTAASVLQGLASAPPRASDLPTVPFVRSKRKN